MGPKPPPARIGPADHHARRIYLVLAALNIVASSLYFDPVYFTWWSFQVSLVLLLTGALDLHTAELCYFCFYDALFVCIGVFTMSVMRSENEDDMLSQIAVADGLLMYAVQTYAGRLGGAPWLELATPAQLTPFPPRRAHAGLRFTICRL